MAVAELNGPVQRDDDASEPSEMPVPERIARLEAQKVRYPGLHFSSEEPSHKFADKIYQMATDQLLEWLPWDQLTSLEQRQSPTVRRSSRSVLIPVGRRKCPRKIHKENCQSLEK